MPNTLITYEIDLEVDGKQTGFLRVPHSVHRSAYGWIPVPIVSIKNSDGPTVLLTAGNHGDEYEGQIALTKLCRDLKAEDLRSQVIILTMTNFPAALAGQRNSPIDDGNLNRTFPGNPLGTPTEAIADYIEDVLLPRCDYLIDLHSGGTSLVYPPTLLRGRGHTAAETNRLEKLQDAFDLPFAWVFTSGGGPQSTARTLMGAANRKAVTSVMAELGGGGSVSPRILAMAERGLRRILHSLAMLPAYEADAARGTRELNALGCVYAYESGLFEPFKEIGDNVAVSEVVGIIQHPDTPWRAPTPVTCPYDGMVLCTRALAQVRRGDAVYQMRRTPYNVVLPCCDWLKS